MDSRADIELLRDYARNGSEEAFSAVVARHVNLVYSVALRALREAHLAEEVTQATFIILARKAGVLNERVVLTAWLYRTARFAAADSLKLRSRRLKYEQEAAQMNCDTTADSAWTQVEPLLDEAVGQLGEKDRAAILLRFFENKNLREVGAALGVNEDSAQKRVARALEKLRSYFAGRGVVLSGTILAGLIASEAVQAAPGGVSSAVLTGVSSTGSVISTSTITIVKGTLKMIALKKLQAIAAWTVITLLAAGTITVVAEKSTRSGELIRNVREADRSTPTGALRYLADALAAYEGQKVAESYFAPTPPRQRFVSAMASVVTAEGQLVKALAEKFGGQTVRAVLSKRGSPLFSMYFGQDDLDSAEEQIQGETATVRLPDKYNPGRDNTLTLRKMGAIWRVDDGEPDARALPLAERKAAAFESISREMTKMTEEVKAGTFKTFDEAMRSLASRTKAVIGK